jgi:PilZ domain
MSETNNKTQAGAERRRTQRMSIPFHIEVCGRESEDTVFQDETTTINVNEHGCKFDLTHQLDRGDVVTIRQVTRGQIPPEENDPILFEVVWAEVRETGWAVGATKLQDKNVWAMTFPAKSSSERPTTSSL